jgi:hypothetical protein
LPCIFCASQEKLTDEHVFSAFMGGKFYVPNGSCKRCNADFGLAEAKLKGPITPLLNLLQISNRYDVVPNAQLHADIRGLDLKSLPPFMDGKGQMILSDKPYLTGLRKGCSSLGKNVSYCHAQPYQNQTSGRNY